MRTGTRFADRADAGRRLAARLSALGHAGPDVVVLGLPRGGVPVAFEVARQLRAPLDVLVVRKLGVPRQPELAMGAIGEGGVTVLNDDVVTGLGVTPADRAAVEERERAILDQRLRLFRRDSAPLPLDGVTALIVDDGIATGSTARAACRVARARGARRVVLAAPVAPPQRLPGLEEDADEVVCLETPSPFFAVGQFYADFSPVPDEEVTALLALAARDRGSRSVASPAAPTEPVAPTGPAARDEPVEIPAGGVVLPGRLVVPPDVQGVVVFAHGSGSSRHSPRNRFVAEVLHHAGLGTLLFDLLTADEEHDRANVFDVDLLARRLAAATAWLRTPAGTGATPIGYFGASTGAAAALWAAAEPDSVAVAVVARGGRPDLAGRRLGSVRAPTLLIVGGRDEVVLDVNRRALAVLRCESRLAVVPGATHLFEEPGTLRQAADLARDWFLAHLGAGP